MVPSRITAFTDVGKEAARGAGGKSALWDVAKPFFPSLSENRNYLFKQRFTQEVCGNYKRLSTTDIFKLICEG